MIHFLSFSNLEKYNTIRHFVSTRHGGVSTGAYKSLNLSFRSGDTAENVHANRKRLRQALELPEGQLFFPEQVHGKQVRYVQHPHTQLHETDALITDKPNYGLCVLSADCVPLLFYDAQQQAIGAAHAGWRGTVQQIGVATVDSMQQHFGTKPQDLWVGVGPTVSPEHYEVGEEVVEAVHEQLPAFADAVLLPHKKPEKAFLDLRAANRLPLEAIGIPGAQIEVLPRCTQTEAELFFSARRQGAKSGRFAAGIVLNER